MRCDIPFFEMETCDFAQSVLFATTLEGKLFRPKEVLTDERPKLNVSLPKEPSRPDSLLHIGKNEFPDIRDFKIDSVRAKALHFFANHELLAMEIMALVLLKFPDAPAAFRRHLVQTLQEEQLHLSLYIDRMNALGVGFGDYPVNDFFWSLFREIQDPMDFITQMSLTFEQANLDFALYYSKQMKRVGDFESEKVLMRIYRDEIKHVKRGLHWFREWTKDEAGSDFEKFQRLLPPPMTVKRAKGLEFCAEARLQAGFDSEFIDALQMFSGSKGRPPTLWYYNPACEFEIAQRTASYQSPPTTEALSADLETSLVFLAKSSDIIVSRRKPSVEFVKRWSEFQAVPEFVLLKDIDSIKAPKIGGIQPWGWSPMMVRQFESMKDRLVPTSGSNGDWVEEKYQHKRFEDWEVGKFYSKAWAAQWVASGDRYKPFCSVEALASVCRTMEEVDTRVAEGLAAGTGMVLKAPYGTSGANIVRIYESKEYAENNKNWAKRCLKHQGSVVVEPLLKRVCDLSIQLQVEKDAIRLIGIRHNFVDSLWQYRATELWPGMQECGTEILSFLKGKKILAQWEETVRSLGEDLRAGGYLGPAGVDAFVFEKNDHLFLKPVSEINCRWTMGRVAIDLEKRVTYNRKAKWVVLMKRHWEKLGFTTALQCAETLEKRFPVEFGPKNLISEGVLSTVDSEQCEQALALLVVGEKAFQWDGWARILS